MPPSEDNWAMCNRVCNHWAARRARIGNALLACLAASTTLPLGWVAAQSTTPLDASTNAAVHWPRKDFIIPFQIDPSGDTPAEIRLEFSENQGQTWSLYTRGDVRSRQFNFHAPRDGEFRFRLKTVDRSGNVFDNPGEPLAVVVDTEKPTGELIVDMDARGTMQMEFRLVDIGLDTPSIRVEYQTDSQSSWTEIPFEHTPGTAAGEWTGFGTWDMPPDATQLMVRLTARDQAGNSVELTRMPRLPRSASTRKGMQLASKKEAEVVSAPIGSGVVRKPAAPSILKSEELTVPKVEVLGGPGAHRPMVALDRDSLARQQVLDTQEKLIEYQNRLLMQQRAIGGWNPNSVNAPSLLPTRPLDDSLTPTPTRAMEVSNTSSAPNMLLGTPPNELAAGPPGSTQLSTLSPSNTVGPSPSDAHLRPQSKRLFSNSTTFSLDYAIENDPGAAITSVELWGTTDQGAVWEKWGTDADRQSPFDIQVEGEGLYGFRMVIVGANGLASRRPLPGDDADAWIQVDTTLPQAKIISVLNGKGPDAGALVVEYLAIDDQFSDRPISLFYSESPKGPWQVITQGARNHGRFVWAADPSLPPTVYIRLEAVDAAGNNGTHQLDLPVDVQSAAPRGRIQGFRPQR